MTRPWWLLAGLCLGLLACGPSSGGAGTDNNNSGGGQDGGGVQRDASGPSRDAYAPIADAALGPNWDAYFADDPPPEYCGVDGGAAPIPGGTPDCPDDKNREGCPCAHPGEQAPCWPGLRVDRNRGICQDGVTTCNLVGELSGAWGPCEGYVLPDPNATMGPGACNCFSAGRWDIDNISPCFITYSGGAIYAVSTWMNGATAQCPSNIDPDPPPTPEPGTDWSTNRLTVDCAGQFHLCYTLRAGDEANPLPGDCEVASVCIDVWYDTPDQEMELPALPAWTSTDPSCAAQFANSGGYGEMSVQGLSAECDPIDDGNGNVYVFHRLGYCPLECNTNPGLPECQNCGNGGSGSF